MKKLRNNGFTLAEVLITLSIIGVVAAMTIPTLLQNQKEQETVSKLKKTYASLSNAYTLTIQENGEIKDWGLSESKWDRNSAETIINNFAKHLNVTKNCGTNSGCFPQVTYKYLRNSNWTKFDTDQNLAKAQLSDGTLVALEFLGNSRPQIARFLVDLNGDKPPNKSGIDLFSIFIFENKLMPYDTTPTSSFNTSCKDLPTAAGDGCTAWVLYNENLDYLHCSDLSWDGKKKCD